MKKIFVSLLILALSISVSSAPNGKTRKLILKVISADEIWIKSSIGNKLETIISRNKNFQVISYNDHNTSTPPFPDNYTSFDALYNWGAEIGGRYVVVVDVKSNSIVKKKTFSFPFLIHRYKSVGVIEGELRVIDIKRGKYLAAEPFIIEKDGPSVIHTTLNNNPNDPDLNISSSKKVKFFRELEDKLTKHLIKRIKFLTNGR